MSGSYFPHSYTTTISPLWLFVTLSISNKTLRPATVAALVQTMQQSAAVEAGECANAGIFWPNRDEPTDLVPLMRRGSSVHVRVCEHTVNLHLHADAHSSSRHTSSKRKCVGENQVPLSSSVTP